MRADLLRSLAALVVVGLLSMQALALISSRLRATQRDATGIESVLATSICRAGVSPQTKALAVSR